jgi:hypothetical protein
LFVIFRQRQANCLPLPLQAENKKKRDAMNVRQHLMFAILCFSIVCHGGRNAVAYDLSRGRQIVLEQGLQLHSLVYTQDQVTLFTDMDLWASANFTAFNFFFYRNPSVLPVLPLDKDFGVASHPSYSSTKFLQGLEIQYADRLISYQYADELPNIPTDPALVSDMKATYAQWRNLYPNVLAYTNSHPSQLTTAQLTNYIQTAEPDMISFDYYPGYSFGTTGRNTWYSTMQQYRQAGLAGLDGTGAKPIPYAQYLQLYRESYGNAKPSESFVRLQQNASWAFGYTFTDAFVYNQFGPANQGTLPTMFDATGDVNPNAVFDYVKESNRQSLNLGPALVRLVSTDVFMLPGTGKSVANTGLTQWSASAGDTTSHADYLTSINPTTSQGGSSDLFYNDILIGYFEPLLANNSDATFADGLHFMIVNGSASGTAATSAQWYRLTFDFQSSVFDSLVRLSRDTGEVELVPLTSLGGSTYRLDLNLPGGTGDLFAYWDSSDPLPTIPEPASMGMLVVAASLCIRCRVGHRWA